MEGVESEAERADPPRAGVCVRCGAKGGEEGMSLELAEMKVSLRLASNI